MLGPSSRKAGIPGTCLRFKYLCQLARVAASCPANTEDHALKVISTGCIIQLPYDLALSTQAPGKRWCGQPQQERLNLCIFEPIWVQGHAKRSTLSNVLSFIPSRQVTCIPGPAEHVNTHNAALAASRPVRRGDHHATCRRLHDMRMR